MKRKDSIKKFETIYSKSKKHHKNESINLKVYSKNISARPFVDSPRKKIQVSISSVILANDWGKSHASAIHLDTLDIMIKNNGGGEATRIEARSKNLEIDDLSATNDKLRKVVLRKSKWMEKPSSSQGND